jgi:predicted permease
MKWPWQKENADLDREVAYHLESLADTYEKQGLSRADAMLRARKEFGGVEQVKEVCRATSRWYWLVQFLQDLRFGARMMRRSPTISVAAILSLALGIGATTAIFTLADAVLWRPIAVPAPEQMLEVLWEVKKNPSFPQSASGSNYLENGLLVSDFFSQASLDAMRQSAAGQLEVASHMGSERVSINLAGQVFVSEIRHVSDNFFSVLRLQPHRGRLMANSAEGPQAVVSHRFWQKRMAGSDSAIGATLRVNDHPFTVVGVLPRDFFGLSPGDEAELYATISHHPGLRDAKSFLRSGLNNPQSWWQQAIARRAPGVNREQAFALLNTAFASSWPSQPETPEQTPRLRFDDASKGLGGLRRDMGDPVFVLLGLVALVLLVACANIANLLLARGAQREKEMALRVSLGGSAGRLMRQFFTESLLLALLGGALSLVVAVVMGSLMRTVLPESLSQADITVDFSLRSLAATAGVTLLTALVFGLYPAWRASRVDAAPALKEGSGSAGTLSRRRWLPAKVLVLAQVTVGVLLVTAAIMATGYLNEIVNREAGFDRTRQLVFDLRPGEIGYQGARLRSFYTNLEDRLRAVPGVSHAALSRVRPMSNGGWFGEICLPGSTRGVEANIHFGSASFLNALGVPIVAGRDFTLEDIQSQRQVAVLSEQLAQRLKLATPLGARVMDSGQQWEVIGVARNARYSRLDRDEPVLYKPLPQDLAAFTVVLRTHTSPMAVLSGVREAVRSLDPNLPLVDIYTMEQQISRTLRRERMFAWLCGSFGVLALVLCVVGLYGLMAHTTARRTPEIGIRMALGASGRQVIRQVLGEGMRLATGGLLLGAPLALYAAHLARQQKLLPEGPIPYWTLAAAAAVLVASAFAAVAGPALRAARIDPIRALRQG